MMAQQVTVSGTVTDSTTSEALVGATVLEKGTSNGVITDESGGFKLAVLEGATLVVSYYGFQTRQLSIGDQTNFNIRMGESISNLDEVIVVGYNTQKQREVTGSVGTVDAEDLVKTPAVTAGGMLVGRVQGITTRARDSRPGASIDLQIRNMGEPLFVIDGVPSDQGQFNQLGLNDIENITILKDGAAAIYGLRAANGVVLVTTKRGKIGQEATININGYYGMSNWARFPRPANAYQYLRARVEAETNVGRAAPAAIPPEELEKWRLGTEEGYESFDYYDFIVRRNVPQYNLNGSISGGTESATYYVSVTHLNQDATIEDYNFNRTNIQANVDAHISDRLTVGTQVYGRIEDRHQVGVPGLDDYFNPILSIFSMWPTERPYANDNPEYINTTHNVNVNPATYTEEVTGYIDETWRSMKANLYAEYEFGFGLKAKATYGYTFANMDFDGFEYTYQTYTYNEATDTYRVTGGNDNPWRERRRNDLIDRVAQVQLTYDETFGDHSVSAVAGFERYDRRSHYFVVHTVPPNNYIPIMSYADQDILYDALGQEARQGFLGRVNYNYKGKYLVEFLGRYDGHFLFPPGSRYGFFPGVSVGWQLGDEKFMQGIEAISGLKLRASYSIVGNTNNSYGYIIEPYSYYSGYDFLTGSGGSAVLDGDLVPGVDPRGLPVTNLSWLENRYSNVGIDLELFDGAIFAQIDAFQRFRDGLPAGRYDVQIPDEVGYTLPAENLEADAVYGIEGAVTYQGRRGAFFYRISGNASFARWRNEVRYKPRYGNSFDQYRTEQEGRWVQNWWGYEVIGQFQSQEEIDNYPINNDGQGNRNMLPGDLIFKDVNEDGIINWLDERPIGYPEGWSPALSYGLNFDFQYRGFSLIADFAGAAMQTFNRYWELRFPFPNNGVSPEYLFEDNWRHEDPYDPTSPWIPGYYPATRNDWGHPNYSYGSTFWLVNVRYIRLRNLQLGYTLPKTLLSKVGVEALQVYVNGSNIFSIDNTKSFEIDPEIADGNGLIYPTTRLINFGFNLTL